MRGAIFMCNRQTRHECFKFRVFGLPASKVSFVRQIKKGMILFLFDTDDRKLYGVYEAISDGGLNYVPRAYEKTGSHFPAQVRFRIIWKCWYLTEAEFKPAIIANYFTPNMFNQYLSFEQVSHLLSLFETKKKIADNENRSPRTSSSASHSPRTNSRLSSNPKPSFNPDPYQFQSSNFDSRRLSSKPNPNTDPDQFQSSSFDNMCLSSNPNPNPDSYQFQMSNFDNMHLISNPNPGSNPYPYQYQYPTCSGPYQYQYDPNNPGIARSSDYNTQHNQQYRIGTGTGTGSELKCEAGLNSNQDHTKPHPFCDYGAIKNKGEYGSSFQPVQFYTSNPENYNNVAMGVEGSNVGEGSQHQSHICNQVPENFYASVFERLQGIPSAQQNPNFAPKSPNPNPRLYADSERPSVFSRLAVREQREETKPSQNDEEPSIDQLLYSLREKSNQWSGQRKEKSKSNQWVNDKTVKSIIEPVEKQSSAEIEAKADPGSDGKKMEMDVDLTEPSLENFELDESQIPFMNFKRRSGERKVSVEPEEEEGSKKKRRFVRPSLENEGPIRKFDISFDEIMKEAETEETNVEKKDSKEAEIELESLAHTMHEFEAKTEEKMVTTDFMDIGREKKNQDLEGPICKNDGPSKEKYMECESLGHTIDEPQEEGEIVFSPLLLQINEEKNTEQLKNVGPAQNDNFSSNEGKNDNVEKFPAFNQESQTEKYETGKKDDPENLKVIELETQNEVGKIELGEKNEVKNVKENLNVVEKEAQNFMEISRIKNCGEIAELELGDEGPTTADPQEEGEIVFSPLVLQINEEKNTEQLNNVGPAENDILSCNDGKNGTTFNEEPKSEKNDALNLNVTDLVTQNLIEISPEKSCDEVGKIELGEKIEEKIDSANLNLTDLATQNFMEISPVKNSGEVGKVELGEIIEEEKELIESESGIPNEETRPNSEIPKEETEPKSSISKDEKESKFVIAKDETEPKTVIPKDETEPKSVMPKDETEVKSGIPNEETKSGIPKEESEPKSGIPKPGLGFDIRSIIRKAKAEKLNEASACKDQEDILNGDFIALD